VIFLPGSSPGKQTSGVFQGNHSDCGNVTTSGQVVADVGAATRRIVLQAQATGSAPPIA
jgi:hypothetical protein